MITDVMVYDDFPKLHGKAICIWGSDERAEHCIKYIEKHHPEITIKFIFTWGETTEFCGYPAYNFATYSKWHDTSSLVVLLACEEYHRALKDLIDHEAAEVYICSRLAVAAFGENKKCDTLVPSVQPFIMESRTPKIPLIISESAVTDGGKTEHYFLADFMSQEYKIYTCDNVRIPLSLRDYSARVIPSKLPMRMSHYDYLLWKRWTHISQLSHSRKFIAAQRYNFFHLDILNLETNEVTRWHDKPASEGLWDYVATGDFDDRDDSLYFVRWPLEDAINGMNDDTNRVHCEVGRLNMETMQAELLAEFDFIDRIHQVTISSDKRYMVFAPMRVLKTPIAPSLLKEEEVISKLREWTILDEMATLDLHTGKVSYTQIPYPIPAHFEKDPLDPHVFYVSTHSLLPHSEGVLIFNPGTIHRLRIVDGVSVIENTYTHPNFIRTAQHCVFVHRGKVLIAATNQNKLEIIDAETMTAWHIHRLLDDPLYDNADFSDPEFLKKPYSLPATPAHCSAISASADGEYLALRMKGRYTVFSLQEKDIVGSVLFPENYAITSHSRYYMQNSDFQTMTRRYSEIWTKA